MAFRSASFQHLASFNSATSSKFLDTFKELNDKAILDHMAELPSKTFAPSSFRCGRKCWFRLRGVEPDVPKEADSIMQFKADVGTACHLMIQQVLVEGLAERNQNGDMSIKWVDVEEYLKGVRPDWEYTVVKNGYETQVSVTKPYPIRFSVDGVLKIDGEYYLLEIKTAEYSSLERLTDPKEQHVAQVQSYCAILAINHVLFMYRDRQYGHVKVYEVTIPEYLQKGVFLHMDMILDMVEKNLAPARLPDRNDPWCQNCNYAVKCSQWG